MGDKAFRKDVTLSPELAIHPHLSIFEAFFNIQKIQELSREESAQILEQVKKAALADAKADAERKSFVMSEEIALKIDEIVNSALGEIGEDSDTNIAVINRAWGEILPKIEYNFELPSDLQKTGTLFIADIPDGVVPSATPGGKALEGIKFIKGRELQYTKARYEHRMWWFEVVNPTDITQSIWIPAGSAMEQVQLAPEIKSGPLDKEFWNALRFYVKRYNIDLHTENGVLNRTYENRLVDHERLLSALLQDRGDIPAREALWRLLYPDGERPTTFIDIGSGVNDEKSPAASSKEIAEEFSALHVVALDLPENVEAFTAKAATPDSPQQKLGEIPNLYIQGGNGLAPLLEQVPQEMIAPDTTVMVRIANSLEIYTYWDTSNGEYPSFVEVVRRMGEELRDHPALLLLNRAIIVKKKGDTSWTVVGRVSSRGFNAIDRRATTRGRFDFELDAKALGSLG